MEERPDTPVGSEEEDAREMAVLVEPEPDTDNRLPEEEEDAVDEGSEKKDEHRFDDDIEEERDEERSDGDDDAPLPRTKAPIDAAALNAEDPDEDEDIDGDDENPTQRIPLTQRPKPGDVFTARYLRIIGLQGAPAKEAKTWLARVLIDGPRAVADILAVVVSSVVTEQSSELAAQLLTQRTVMENDPTKSVGELCDALNASALDVSGTLISYRKSRTAYQDFWTRIAAESSDAIMFDTDCFDTLLSWLEAMSTAKLSVMRHAACVAAYSIVDGLIQSGATLRKRLVLLQRQLNLERKKCEKKAINAANKKNKKGTEKTLPAWTDKYKRLDEEVAAAATNNGELVELADKVFTGVFVLKYRDVAPEIRVASVEFLGKWIMRHPDHYLDDTHTKYIGWLLSDKDPNVRKTCVAALTDMLVQPDFFPALELFLRRFIARILEMCNDTNNDVSVRSLRICALLVQHDILEDSAVEKLTEFLQDESNSAVRKAAGEFVAAYIADPDDDPDDDDAAPTKKYRRKKTIDINAGIPTLEKSKYLLRELAQLIVTKGRKNSPKPDAALILDGMWEVMPALRSWQAYAALLEEDHDDDEDDDDTLDENQKALLCEIMVLAAKKVVDEKKPPSATVGKKSARKQGTIRETCRDALARIFTPLIPKFLMQYQGNARIVSNLVQMPKFFSNEQFTEASQKKHFLTLLERLVGAISRHTGSKTVLNATVGTFKNMMRETHPLAVLTKEALAKAAKEAAKDLRALVRGGVEKNMGIRVGAAALKASIISDLKELPEEIEDDVNALLDIILEKDMPAEFNTNIAIDSCHVAFQLWIRAFTRMMNLYGNRMDNEERVEDDHVDQMAEEKKNTTEKLNTSLENLLQRLARFAEYPFNLRVRVHAASRIGTLFTLKSQLSLFAKKNDGDDAMDTNKGDISPTDMGCAAVKECVLDLIAHQWGMTTRHPKVLPRYEDGKDVYKDSDDDSEQKVEKLIRAVIQGCIIRGMPDRFLHLPFLCYLLNRRKGAKEVEKVCNAFLVRKLNADKNEGPEAYTLVLDALRECGELEGSRKHQAIPLLARALSDATPKKGCTGFFADLLGALLDECGMRLDNASKTRQAISVLGKCNVFFVNRLDREEATKILGDMKETREKITNADDMDGNQEIAMLLYPILQVAEAASEGRVAPVPSSSRTGQRGRPRKPKKRPSQKSYTASQKAKTSGEEGLRRSTRKRKAVVWEEITSEEEDSDDDEMVQEMEDDMQVAEEEIKASKEYKKAAAAAKQATAEEENEDRDEDEDENEDEEENNVAEEENVAEESEEEVEEEVEQEVQVEAPKRHRKSSASKKTAVEEKPKKRRKRRSSARKEIDAEEEKEVSKPRKSRGRPAERKEGPVVEEEVEEEDEMEVEENEDDDAEDVEEANGGPRRKSGRTKTRPVSEKDSGTTRSASKGGTASASKEGSTDEVDEQTGPTASEDHVDEEESDDVALSNGANGTSTEENGVVVEEEIETEITRKMGANGKRKEREEALPEKPKVKRRKKMKW